MKPSDENRTGVENYDHSAYVGLPEYFKAKEALNDLVNAINRHGVGPSSDTYPEAQAVWLRLVEQLATSLPYADACEGCDAARWPIQTKVLGEML